MEETGQTVQETQKVQAEQIGQNEQEGKNVGMPECETMELIMESRSENEDRGVFTGSFLVDFIEVLQALRLHAALFQKIFDFRLCER